MAPEGKNEAKPFHIRGEDDSFFFEWTNAHDYLL